MTFIHTEAKNQTWNFNTNNSAAAVGQKLWNIINEIKILNLSVLFRGLQGPSTSCYWWWQISVMTSSSCSSECLGRGVAYRWTRPLSPAERRSLRTGRQDRESWTRTRERIRHQHKTSWRTWTGGWCRVLHHQMLQIKYF